MPSYTILFTCIYIHTRHTTPYYTILYHTIPYYTILFTCVYIYTPYYTMQNRNITYHTIQNRNATLHMNSMNITLHRIEVPPVTVVFSTVSYISYPTLPHHTVVWSYINYIAYTTCPFFPRPPLIAFRTCRNPCCLGTTQKAFTSFSITIWSHHES